MTTQHEVAELGPEPGLCAPCTYLPPEGTTRPHHEGVLPMGLHQNTVGGCPGSPGNRGRGWGAPKMGGEDPLKEVCLEGLKTRTWPRTLVRKRTSSPCEYYES